MLIWPNQKKIPGLVSASPEEIAKAEVTALYASRFDTLSSVPMLMSMVGHGGFLPSDRCRGLAREARLAQCRPGPSWRTRKS